MKFPSEPPTAAPFLWGNRDIKIKIFERDQKIRSRLKISIEIKFFWSLGPLGLAPVRTFLFATVHENLLGALKRGVVLIRGSLGFVFFFSVHAWCCAAKKGRKLRCTYWPTCARSKFFLGLASSHDLVETMVFVVFLTPKKKTEAAVYKVNAFISATDPPLFLGAYACRDPGEGQFWVGFRRLLVGFRSFLTKNDQKLTENRPKVDPLQGVRSECAVYEGWRSVAEIKVSSIKVVVYEKNHTPPHALEGCCQGVSRRWFALRVCDLLPQWKCTRGYFFGGMTFWRKDYYLLDTCFVLGKTWPPTG